MFMVDTDSSVQSSASGADRTSTGTNSSVRAQGEKQSEIDKSILPLFITVQTMYFLMYENQILKNFFNLTKTLFGISYQKPSCI